MSGFVFDLDRPTPDDPAISVICINKNHGEYIEENILSVLYQKHENFEFIVGDGGSTDKSLQIINQHKFITLVSGKDSSRGEGLRRALALARGRYVMVTTSTDGYLSRDWFAQATAVLDRDPEVSLVFGASATMSSEGTLGPVVFPSRYPFNGVPQKDKWPTIWLLEGFAASYLPELNYCVRMNVYRALFANSDEFPELNQIDPILRFHFEFNRLGYLPYYLPVVANFGRSHANQEQFSETNHLHVAVYEAAWKRYNAAFVGGRVTHHLRDGAGKPFAMVTLKG